MNLKIDTSPDMDKSSYCPVSPTLFNMTKEFHSAKIKLDDFFLEWLSQDVTRRMIDLEINELSLHSINLDLSGKNGKLSFLSTQPTPPRSPTKKSPKKRTQDEMFSNNNLFRTDGSITTSNISSRDDSNHGHIDSNILSVSSKLSLDNETDYIVSSAGIRRRANFDSIPIFYQPNTNFTSGKSSPTRLSNRRIKEDSLVNRLHEIELFFKPFPQGRDLIIITHKPPLLL